MKNLLLQLALLPFLVASCATDRSGAASQSVASIEIIANKQSDVKAVDAAIHSLGPVTEAASFWAEIANDTSYRPEHRRRCVFQLFRRHVRKGMSLAEVAQQLNRPNWLPDENVHEVKLIGGLIPVKITPGDTVIALIILPPAQGDKSAVYLRVGGKVRENELGKVLRGEPGGEQIANRKLNEIGFSEH